MQAYDVLAVYNEFPKLGLQGNMVYDVVPSVPAATGTTTVNASIYNVDCGAVALSDQTFLPGDDTFSEFYTYTLDLGKNASAAIPVPRKRIVHHRLALNEFRSLIELLLQCTLCYLWVLEWSSARAVRKRVPTYPAGSLSWLHRLSLSLTPPETSHRIRGRRLSHIQSRTVSLFRILGVIWVSSLFHLLRCFCETQLAGSFDQSQST